MKWTGHKKTLHVAGDVRTISKFLWLPCTLDGQTRWLERARIIQRYYVRKDNEACWLDYKWEVPSC